MTKLWAQMMKNRAAKAMSRSGTDITITLGARLQLAENSESSQFELDAKAFPIQF